MYFFAFLLLSLSLFSFSNLVQAETTSQVVFSADTILSMEGISEGDLYIASSSRCDLVDVSGPGLEVTAIPAGENFALKTPSSSPALQVTPSGGEINLSFNTANLEAGRINQWTLNSSSSDLNVSQMVTVPKANTYYEVKVNGSGWDFYQSNSSAELTFNYNGGFSTKTFTISEGSPPEDEDTASGSVVPPSFFDPVFDTEEDVAETDDTKQESKKEDEPELDLEDGDVVTTKASPDVWILNESGEQKYRRLILNPSIFDSYGHLSWDEIKEVQKSTLEEYTISNLVQEVNPDGSIADPRVFVITPSEGKDTGTKHHLDVSASEFEQAGLSWTAISQINSTEASDKFYPQGDPITSDANLSSWAHELGN